MTSREDSFEPVGDHLLEVRRIASERPGPTLVFLHEGLGSVSTWREFPTRVADSVGLPALVYSRAGYGKSSPVALPRPPLTYMHDEARDVVPALLDALSITEAILVGHSDGGSIALAYAATHHGRARVRGLVLEAPHVVCEAISVTAIEQARQAYLTGDLRDRLARHHTHVDVAFWGWNRAWLDPSFVNWSLLGDLPRVQAPVLVLQGHEDPYGTIAQVEAIEAGCSGPVQSLMFANCGHVPHRDRADETLRAVAAFVQALGPAPSD